MPGPRGRLEREKPPAGAPGADRKVSGRTIRGRVLLHPHYARASVGALPAATTTRAAAARAAPAGAAPAGAATAGAATFCDLVEVREACDVHWSHSCLGSIGSFAWTQVRSAGGQGRAVIAITEPPARRSPPYRRPPRREPLRRELRLRELRRRELRRREPPRSAISSKFGKPAMFIGLAPVCSDVTTLHARAAGRSDADHRGETIQPAAAACAGSWLWFRNGCQCPAHRLRLAGDHPQIRFGGGVRFLAALLPTPGPVLGRARYW